MKNILWLLLLLSLICMSQEEKPRSEVITYRSHRGFVEGRLLQTDTVLLQINERMGDNDAKIAIPYTKGDRLSIGDAWISDADGRIIRKLKGKEIIDRSNINDFSLYQDDFVKMFELVHNVYPYRVYYTFSKEYKKSHFLAIIYGNTKLQQPIRDGKLVVEVPQKKEIRYRQRNVDAPIINTDNGKVRYTWTYAYQSTPYEINTSYATGPFPEIEVWPLEFKFGESGSWASWQSFGNWMYRLNKGKDILPETEKLKIDQLLTGVTDEREKARILYHYLQDMHRYINVSVNLGGMQTYPAKYVCENRYGDCKALSNYMQSMLKYVGIQSYYTLINSNPKTVVVNKDFPSDKFNHIILTVPFGRDTVFLECTSKNIPFGFTPQSIQGQTGLMVDENNSQLVTLPILDNKNILSQRDITVNLHIGEVSPIKIESKKRGEDFERIVSLSENWSKNTFERYIREWNLAQLSQLDDYKVDRPNRDSAFISLTIDCRMSNISKKMGNNLSLYSFPKRVDRYEIPTKRKQEVKIDHPTFYEDKIVYVLDEYKLSKIPDNIRLDTPYGQYSVTFEKVENNLVVYKSLYIKAQFVPLKEYKTFYDFMVNVHNLENRNYFIEIL